MELELELAKQDTPAALAFMELHGSFRSARSEVFMALLDGPKSSPVSAMVRRLAPRLAPLRYEEEDGPRVGVIAYLAQLSEPQDLPELRRSLVSENAREFIYAIEAVLKLKDQEAIPRLKTVSYSDSVFAVRAKDALVLLSN